MTTVYIIDEPEAEYPSPAQEGDTVRVRANQLTLVNNCGGTTMLTHPATEVQVTRAFWDYECGWRFRGRLLHPARIEEARIQGTSEYTPEHYEQTYPNNPDLARSVRDANRSFDPTQVYFSEHDLVRAE